LVKLFGCCFDVVQSCVVLRRKLFIGIVNNPKWIKALIGIGLQMFAAQAVIGAEAPGFQVREHPVHSGNDNMFTVRYAHYP
jgi:hypothetical protein